MTDQRYDGPDGAKRLKMLEALASAFSRWPFSGPGRIAWLKLREISAALDRDNERVDRSAALQAAMRAEAEHGADDPVEGQCVDRLEPAVKDDDWVPFDSFDKSVAVD